MGYPSLDPEMALQLYRAVFYSMAYMFGGAALIALSIYIVLLGSEMLFSEPRSKTQRARLPQPARRAPVAEETLVPSSAETPILAAPEGPGKEAVWVNTPPRGTQIPTTVATNLQSEPTGP
jgi:hypothetical protein